MKYIIKIGQKLGKWTVLSEDLTNKKKRYFLCRCDCGTEKSVQISNLFLGKTLSCGCYKSEILSELKRKNNLNPGFNRLLSSYKWNAINRNLEWNLSDIEVESIFKANCFYCNTIPSQIRKTRASSKWEFIYNGIDRLDNSKGYIQGNVVACCGMCNLAKSDSDLESFYDWIRRLIEYHAKI